MAGQTTYEIYTLANGRWLVDSGFESDQKETAIEEAKRLSYQPGIEQVKVIREAYDEDNSLIKESTIYNSNRDGETKSAGVVCSPAPAIDKDRASFKTAKLPARQRAAGKRSNIQARPNRTQSPTAATSPPLSASVRLAYKMFFIGIVSFAFATTMALIYTQSVMS